MSRRWDPASWVGWSPNGLGQVKPNHYLEIFRTIWQNRDEIPYAWRILTQGVCDGCALGTTGIRDFTLEGVHLCMVRLDLMRLNTMPALDHRVLAEVSTLRKLSSAQLRELGRLPFPMIRRKGERGFSRLSWDAALDLIADKIRPSAPRRIAFYLTSRGITNEVYYVAQKVARFLGTNNVDNSARICHSPSTVALKATLGVAASTCSYTDWLGTDLMVFFGSNVANNQPVSTKYLYYAKKNGAKVAVINPFREPGMERYWVPSVPESALFGTRLADTFFGIHTGGDVAFLNGVTRHILEHGWEDADFIREHTVGIQELRDSLRSQSWEDLEAFSGASRGEMLRFARMIAEARSAVFVWSMGITQHRYGVANVRAIINLSLTRGFVGRENSGLMPIRGHSGVQGSAEVGAIPNQFPGGVAIDVEGSRRFSELYGFAVPEWRGLSAPEMLETAHGGDLDLLYTIGGNFLETLPEPEYVGEALKRVPVRIHQDIVVSSPMLLEPQEFVILLPGQTRYEQRGGGTETSTERRILFSPEISGRRIGESKAEWEIPMLVAERVDPGRAGLIHFESAQAIRNEIGRVVPLYDGIQNLRRAGDQVQWGGRTLCSGGKFGTPDCKARFSSIPLPNSLLPPGRFFLSTRRGKQFNSMIHRRTDPLTGARRSDVLMNREDALSRGLKDGDPLLLRSEVGEFAGLCKIVPMQPGNVQVHWPEGNVLIRRGVRDPESGMPDYNAVVEVLSTSAARTR